MNRAIFFLWFLLVPCGLLAMPAVSGKPGVALYGFEYGVNDDAGARLAEALGSYLAIELGNSNSIDLLDRSLLLDVVGEKTALAQRNVTGAAITLEKLPVSKFLVTGVVLNNSLVPTVSVKVISTETGAVLGVLHTEVAISDLDAISERMQRFVHDTIAGSQLTRLSGNRSVAIGNFVAQAVSMLEGEIDSNSTGTPDVSCSGVTIREGLIGGFVNHPGFQVYARTQMYPLLLESHLHNLQYKEQQSIEKPESDLYIHGVLYKHEHGADGPLFALNLYFDQIGQRRTERRISGSSCVELYEKTMRAVDFLMAQPAPITEAAQRQAEIYFQRGVRAARFNMSFTVPFSAWQQAPETDKAGIIGLFQKALADNPGHEAAQLALAYIGLANGLSNKTLLLQNLERVLLTTTDEHLRKVAGNIIQSYTKASWTWGVEYSQRELLEQKRGESREASYQVAMGQQLTGLVYNQPSFGVPVLNVESLNRQLANNSAGLNMAMDNFSAAAWLQRDMYMAMTFMGYVLSVGDEKQKSQAQFWFDYVVKNSRNDNIKFFAADATDSVHSLTFSDSFEYVLLVEEYLAKKYRARLRLALAEYDIEHPDQQADLETAYINTLYAYSRQMEWRLNKKKSVSSLRSVFNDRLGFFGHLTQQGQDNHSAAEVRERLLETLKVRSTAIYPHLVLLDFYTSPNLIEEQLSLLAALKDGKVTFLSRDLLNQQLSVLSGSFAAREEWQKAILFAERISPTNDEDHTLQALLAYLFFNRGDKALAAVKVERSGLSRLALTGFSDAALNGVFAFQGISGEGFPEYVNEADESVELVYEVESHDLGKWILKKEGIKRFSTYGRYSVLTEKGWNMVIKGRARNATEKVIMALVSPQQAPVIMPEQLRVKPNYLKARVLPVPVKQRRESDIYALAGSDVILGNSFYALSDVLPSRNTLVSPTTAISETIRSTNKPPQKNYRDATIDVFGDHAVLGLPRDFAQGSLLTAHFLERRFYVQYDTELLIERLFEYGFLNVYRQVTDKFKVTPDRLDEYFSDLPEGDLRALKRVLKGSLALNTGAAYFLSRHEGGWRLDEKLISRDAVADAAFGTDVAIDNAWIAVCTRGTYERKGVSSVYMDTRGGGIYLFQLQNGIWREHDKVMEGKCSSVVLQGERLLVGLRNPKTQRGAVYAYEFKAGEWQQQQSLVADDFTEKEGSFLHYGASLDISGDYAVVGNSNDEYKKSSYVGSAYLFKYGAQGWKQVLKLYPKGDDVQANYFGRGVAIDGEQLLIGAPGTPGLSGEEILQGVGKAYRYQRSEGMWQLVDELFPHVPVQNLRFGENVDINTNTILIGKFINKVRQVYLYDFSAEK